ncbi:SRPBCC family protein [Streptomyces sp. NBC_01264]|uniref:SRPBCC family protein n=1 Tax=Streptomyces sp. NBC_01264 TaxID=2903804 RepID=UPI00225B4B3B|nr:SRPBCC family protein [Streptomyces sp. NBC_01264]MCX4782725.1 SRPBCC family protein [Streptomyces sp. NBC_01264]
MDNHAKVIVKGNVACPAAVVWGRVVAFGDIAQWHPLISRSIQENTPGPGGGAVRALTTHDGAAIREELTACDPAARTLAYTFLTSPFTVTNYCATMEVSETGSASCLVTWTATFEPNDPADGARLRDLFANEVFRPGIEALNPVGVRPETGTAS